MWTTPVIISSVLGALGFGLSVYNTVVQKRIKKAEVFETRWFRYLELLKSLPFPQDEIPDLEWNGNMSLSISFAKMNKPATIKEIQQSLSSHNKKPLLTPENLYSTFKSLALLRASQSKDKRDFLDHSLTVYLDRRYVTHALYQALRHADSKTVMFLIETNLIATFGDPSIKQYIGILKVACKRK
jgi:hypothetical protein